MLFKERAERVSKVIESTYKTIPVYPTDRISFHKYLSQMLHLCSRMLYFRAEYIELCGQFYSEASRIAGQFDLVSPSYELQRKSGGGRRNRYAEAEGYRSPSCLISKLPDVVVLQEATEHQEILEQLAEKITAYRKWLNNLLSELPSFVPGNGSRALPHSVRSEVTSKALGLIEVFESGRTTRNLCDHSLFGLRTSMPKMPRAIRAVQRQLRTAHLTKPVKIRVSWSYGEQVMRAESWKGERLEAVARVDRLLNDRDGVHQLRIKWYGMYRDYFIGSGIVSGRLSFIAKKEGRMATVRFLNKFIECYRASPTAVPTGQAIKLTDTDFAVPAAWMDARNEYRTVVRGWLLVRKGWRDCIHVTELPSQEQATRMLTLAISHYGDTSYHSLKQRRKHLAQAVLACRKVPVFTKEDSFAVGNCVPGTEQWIKSLEIDAPILSGKELAKRWWRKGFPNPERFVPVVKALYAKVTERLEQEFIGPQQPLAGA